jgi:hypothetical protein
MHKPYKSALSYIGHVWAGTTSPPTLPYEAVQKNHMKQFKKNLEFVEYSFKCSTNSTFSRAELVELEAK